MRISLIMATLGRSADIDVFFRSIPTSQASSVDFVVVDQNSDDRVGSVLALWSCKYKIKHVRMAGCGLSKARNLGLKYADGDIIGFPDDDCLYEDSVLSRVRELIGAGFDFVALTAKAPGGGRSNGFWLEGDSVINFFNVINCIVSYSVFFRRSAIERIRFDELLGVGAKYGAGEELDFVLEAMHRGASGFFDSTVGVVHPYKLDDWRRGYNYGRGFGAYWIKELTMRRGFEFAFSTAGILIRPLVGTFLSAARFDWDRCLVRAASAIGRIEGALRYRTEEDGNVV